MLKKIVGLVLAVSVILASVNVEVKANSNSYTYGSYTCYGSCWISQYSAGGSTTAVPKTTVEVSGTYYFIVHPDSANPITGSSYDIDVDSDGYAHIAFSVSGDRESYAIYCSHTITGSGSSIGTSEVYQH